MTTTLAQDIVTTLWEDGCLKGSDDKWHRESLAEYQARLIDIIQETINASQRPNEDATKPKGSSEVGGVFTLPKHMLNRRFSKSEAPNHDGDDRMGTDMGTLPCS